MGFAIYLASKSSYKNAVLPNGWPGTAEEALDGAYGRYLNDHRPAHRLTPDDLRPETTQ